MATEVQGHPEQSVVSLASGVVNDVQDLVKQQLGLMRQEVAAELRMSVRPATLLAVGFAFCLAAAFALCLMVAHLLHWVLAPVGADPSHLPLWACYAIAAGAFLAGGGAVVLAARKQFEAIGTPLRHTAQALKENIEWKTTTSAR
jgi:hypothetical protein